MAYLMMKLLYILWLFDAHSIACFFCAKVVLRSCPALMLSCTMEHPCRQLVVTQQIASFDDIREHVQIGCGKGTAG